MPFMPRFYYLAFLLVLISTFIMVFSGGFLVRKDAYVEMRTQEAQVVSAEIAQRLVASNRSKRPTFRFASPKDVGELPAALAQMPQLAHVDVSNTKVTDLGALRGLTGLLSVGARKTRVSDLSPLSGLAGLRELDVSASRITDVAPIAGLRQLEVLKLTYTDVADISALAHHPSLRLVEVQRAPVLDLRPALTWPAMRPYMAVDPDHGGLRFGFSKAAQSDPVLAAMTKGQPRARLGKLAR